MDKVDRTGMHKVVALTFKKMEVMDMCKVKTMPLEKVSIIRMWIMRQLTIYMKMMCYATMMRNSTRRR